MGDINLSLEPTWPWSIPHVGMPAMFGVAMLLVGLTIWTYAGVPKATWQRVLVVLSLRLTALALTFLMLMRPSFGVTYLEGVENSKLLVIFDASESMNVADMADSATRWQHVKRIWESRAVQQRLEDLAAEQRIEVVKYLGADDLRAHDPAATANGKRTDIGAWLHQLWQKHGHEKHLRGLAIFSDGADNGTRFSATAEAQSWRGVCPIVAFGVGNPNDPKFRRDIGLTKLDVTPTPVPVKSKMIVRAEFQAPGYEKTEVDVGVWIEDVATNKSEPLGKPRKFLITKEKNEVIPIEAAAPDSPGEYKVTVKITPQPDEVNKDNNEISTYVQVVKEKISILWVDRPRAHEPILAIRTIKSDPRFDVHYVVPPLKGIEDPIRFYHFDKQPYDVIVIGDISAQRFSFGKEEVFGRVKKLVHERKTGLLMLGGEETFGSGGWQKHPEWMALMPVDFAMAGYSNEPSRVWPTPEGTKEPFLQIMPDAKKNDVYWRKDFEPLDGIAMIGNLTGGSTPLLMGEKNALAMAATQSGGRVVVFAGDTTAGAWLTPETNDGYQHFWKQLTLWLAQQRDDTNQLWIKLDMRRVNTAASEVLGFTFGLKDKKGADLPNAKFTSVKVVGPQRDFPVTFLRENQHQRGVFQDAKEPGEYQLIIEGHGKDLDGKDVSAKGVARFLVVSDDIEKLRPVADHEMLSKIAAAADGRFFLADEASVLQYLDELKSQINSESHHKTTQWPDWRRLPPSDHARDQLAALWHSFALVGFLLFTALLGCEWLLRRLWGLV